MKTSPLTQSAVVGMGSMGTDIALALILAGVPAVVLGPKRCRLDQWNGQDPRIRSKNVCCRDGSRNHRLNRYWRPCQRRRAGMMSPRADLVIESVYEDVEVKRSVIKRLDDVCPGGTILATNTSTIPLDELTTEMRNPQRLIGMHFFNPAHRMPLLEIVRRDVTPPRDSGDGDPWSKTLRKTPVLVASRVGFLVNRLFVPYVQEAFQLLEEGAAAAAIDQGRGRIRISHGASCIDGHDGD